MRRQVPRSALNSCATLLAFGLPLALKSAGLESVPLHEATSATHPCRQPGVLFLCLLCCAPKARQKLLFFAPLIFRAAALNYVHTGALRTSSRLLHDHPFFTSPSKTRRYQFIATPQIHSRDYPHENPVPPTALAGDHPFAGTFALTLFIDPALRRSPSHVIVIELRAPLPHRPRRGNDRPIG